MKAATTGIIVALLSGIRLSLGRLTMSAHDRFTLVRWGNRPAGLWIAEN
jgi:hypothetical protein